MTSPKREKLICEACGDYVQRCRDDGCYKEDFHLGQRIHCYDGRMHFCDEMCFLDFMNAEHCYDSRCVKEEAEA